MQMFIMHGIDRSIELDNVSPSEKPALEHRPPDQGEKEDCKTLGGICDDAADEYEGAEEAEDDGVAGPGSVRAMNGCVFAAAEDE